MNNPEKVFDGVLITLGTITGIANIEHILGIIILIIQIAWICIKIAMKIITTIKEKKDFSSIDSEVNSAINDLQGIKDSIAYRERADNESSK